MRVHAPSVRVHASSVCVCTCILTACMHMHPQCACTCILSGRQCMVMHPSPSVWSATESCRSRWAWAYSTTWPRACATCTGIDLSLSTEDLSANNVLLSSNMGAKISDLGVAKILNMVQENGEIGLGVLQTAEILGLIIICFEIHYLCVTIE